MPTSLRLWYIKTRLSWKYFLFVPYDKGYPAYLTDHNLGVLFELLVCDICANSKVNVKHAHRYGNGMKKWHYMAHLEYSVISALRSGNLDFFLFHCVAYHVKPITDRLGFWQGPGEIEMCSHSILSKLNRGIQEHT